MLKRKKEKEIKKCIKECDQKLEIITWSAIDGKNNDFSNSSEKIDAILKSVAEIENTCKSIRRIICNCKQWKGKLL